MRLNLDASCNENGPILSLDLMPCVLVLIIVKSSKLVTMEAQTFLNSGASTCIMDKELVRQYNKLALVKKSTLMPVEIIDGQNLSSRPITHETKSLHVTIGSHSGKVVFNVILFSRILSSLDCFGLFYIIHEWIGIWGVFILKHHNTKFWNVKPS
jgi:hypothetical protein